MSHAPPITLQITAMRQDQMYQGIDSVLAIANRRSSLHLGTLGELSLPWRFFREGAFNFSTHKACQKLQSTLVQLGGTLGPKTDRTIHGCRRSRSQE